MTDIENRMVIDSEWPDSRTTPWQDATDEDIFDFLDRTGELTDAVREFLDSTDPLDIYDMLDTDAQNKLIEEYVKKHERCLAARYTEYWSGCPY